MVANYISVTFINHPFVLGLMKARVVNFRMSKHRQKDTHMVILVEGTDSKEKASKLVGKSVIWTSPAGKEIKGRVSAPHGSKGTVRAIFETGMPGQSLATKVSIE